MIVVSQVGFLYVRKTLRCRVALCVPRRECQFSARATRHTVDSAIDPVCPLGPAQSCLYTHTHTLCMARQTACCVFAIVCLWCVCMCVCDYCVMYIHSIHSSGSLTLSVPNEPK